MPAEPSHLENEDGAGRVRAAGAAEKACPLSDLAQNEPSGKPSSSVALGDYLGPGLLRPGDAFHRFWRLGYHRLLPVVPPSAMIRSAGKRPGLNDGAGWFGLSAAKFDAIPADLERWAKMGAGVGIRCDTGVVAADIDCRSAEHVAIIREIAHRTLGPAPARIGNSPKELLPYRGSEPMTYRQFRFDDGVDPQRPGLVEFLAGEAKWFVADGIHPTTMQPYVWPRGVPAFDELAIVTPAQVEAFFLELANVLPGWRGGSSSVDREKVDQASLVGTPDRVRKAIEALPNDPAIFGYNEWLKIGVALRGALPDDEALALELFEDWTEKGQLAEEKENAARVFFSVDPPFAVGADYLANLAVKHSGGVFTDAERWFDVEAGKTAAIKSEKAANTAAARFAFEDFDDLAADATGQTASPLVKGLLDQGAMSVLYGESNSGKTFVMLDLAFHVATGRPWSGLKTTPMLVVYVAAEGGRGFAKRVAALKSRHGSVSAVDLKVLRSQVDLLRAEADLKPLIAALRGLGRPIGFLVIDTLSRAMAGGDENSSVDMGATVKHLDALRAATGAHLAVVHHSGKNPAKGARGHSLLRAATDTEIEIADGEIIVTKQRDLERSFRKSFVLDGVTLGVDDDGDPVTSATVRVLDRPAEDQAAPPTAEEIERRERVARAACRALKGQTTAKLAGLLSTLTVELKREGVVSGASLPTVRTLLVAALGDGVEVEFDGQVVRMEIRQDGSGPKAPWLIVASRVPRETKISIDESGSDNLSGEFSADERLESGGVFG